MPPNDPVRDEREAFHQSEALFHIACRLGRLGAWAIDLPDLTVTWSDEIRAIHEVPHDYVPTVKTGLAFYAPDYRPVIESAITDCMRQGKPFDLELQIITARGKRVWVRGIGEAERDERGTIRRVIGAFQDISGPKTTAELNRQLAERLTRTLESITDAFFTLDREWRFTFANAEGELLLQRSGEDLLGKVVWDAFPEARGSAFEIEYRRAVETRQPVEFETFYPPLDKWVAVRAYPSEHGLTIYARDITAQHAARTALLESERRFRTLTEAMPQMVWMTRPDGSNIYVNQRWVDYTGLTPEESHGEGWVIPVHPDDRARASQAWKDAASRRGAYEVESRLRRFDGVYRWWLIRGLPMFDADGSVTTWLGTSTDIDELKHALVRIEQQASLIDEARDAIVVRDLDHRIVSWSRGAERLYGFPAAEAIGRRFDELLHVRNDHFGPAMKALIERGEWSEELERTTRSGSVVTVDSRWSLLRDFDGQPKGILTLDTDITERKRAERQLQESEERYRLLFDRNPHPTWVYDTKTLAFLAVNQSAIQHYGYSRDEFLRMTIKDIRPPEDVSELVRLVHERPEATTPQVFGIFKHRKKDGTIIEVEIASSEITFSGRQAGLVLAVDVSERRRLEQQFLRVQRMESIGTLASGIAHDLNNILMPVMMGVTLLKRDNPSERAARAIDNMEKSAVRGKALVQQVLSFARGVEGSRVPVHMRDIIREVQSIIESTFPKNILLQVDVPHDLAWVEGDPTQLNQVVLNLCVNARDAMPNGGRLVISARNELIDQHYASMNRDVSAGPHVLIEVIDEGTGIAPHMIDRIFEPFYTTKELGRGTGLGLSTVAAIVRSHHGSVNVYSEPGRGSAFRVYIPAKPAGERSEQVTPARLLELPRGDGELILIADDEASILGITQQTLEAFGYRTLTADDGAQAIGLFAMHRSEIAAVITDMMMPVMDGPALIAALRRIDPKVRIVASSGLHDSARAARGAHADVSHFLQKPYSAELLLITLRDILGKR